MTTELKRRVILSSDFERAFLLKACGIHETKLTENILKMLVLKAHEIHENNVKYFNETYNTKEFGTNGNHLYPFTNGDKIYDLNDKENKKLKNLFFLNNQSQKSEKLLEIEINGTFLRVSFLEPDKPY